MKYVQETRVECVDGYHVGVVTFTEQMKALSCAVLNGGLNAVSAAFIMQVPKDYDCLHPREDAERVRMALDLPPDTLGMMTAAEVEHVFNVTESVHGEAEAAAIATAGLSNHVIAGDELTDYEEKSRISAKRHRDLCGTINICAVSSVPMSIEGMVNFLIPVTEAKTAALAKRGFRETGTTSDAVAAICPQGGGESWTGTGSDIGIAAASAVREAVGFSLDMRNEHPAQVDFKSLLRSAGMTEETLWERLGGVGDFQTFERRMRLAYADIDAISDIVWYAEDRADSLMADGNGGVKEFLAKLICAELKQYVRTDRRLSEELIAAIAERVIGYE